MELKKKYITPEMRIIPMEHRDIITGSNDPEAEIESMSWRESEYWNILLPLFMSLLLGFSSCHDEDLPNPPERELVPASFSVEIEGDAETRLSFVDYVETPSSESAYRKLDFHFETEDKIKLYDGCSKPHELTYNAENSHFEGSVCPNGTYANYRAVYPASTTSDYNKVSISATQTAVTGSFDKASAPMIAYYNHDQNKLYFKPAFSFLKITVPVGYSKIVVSNYSSDSKEYYLTGDATLTYDSEVIVTKASGGKSSVSLVPASGQSAIPAGTYYMSVFPCSLSGLQMACYKGDQISFKCKKASTDLDKKIDRNKGVSLGNLAASDWTFTCEAVNIGCIFDKGVQKTNYYIADKNLGATESNLQGTKYSQTDKVDPATVLGPGWELPSTNVLEYWAGIRKNNDAQTISSSFDEENDAYIIKRNTSSLAISLPAPSNDSGNYIGRYWGNDDQLYIKMSVTGTLSKEIKEDSSDAFIRPVFPVPVQ